MQNPIQAKIGTVFIPVSDMNRSIAWYSRLFGLPHQNSTHEGRIYDVPMTGETRLTLDSHKPVTNSSQPLCSFWTEDITAAHQHLLDQSMTVVSPPQDIGSVSFLTFQDPDGNLLMLYQPNH